MPVKVRCQSCEKVFAAPDAARGKLVKCPGCEEKVKVPAGDGAKSGAIAKPAAKKPAKKSEHHDDHEHALKNLDLDNVEDENVRICPKCGQEIYEEETFECPGCGLNFETGVTKEKQKGVDSKLFFRVAFKESMKFMKENKPLALRTGVYSLIFSLLYFGCVFMITWVVAFPPRIFWMGLAFITAMVPNGWLWFLNSEIIKATMDKKEKLPRINFDMFTCVALGIKYLVWRVVMGVQLVLPMVVGALTAMKMPIPAAVVQGLFELVLFLMLPQVMVHMTMPVTTRGWLMHIQFQAWAKSFSACFYWAAITFVMMLPSLVPVGLAFGIKYKDVGEFAGTIAYNFRANSQLGADLAAVQAKKNNPKKGEMIEEVKLDDPKYQTKSLPWKGIIIPAIGVVLSQMMFGFGAVFSMKANGLLGLYYKRHLKLDTMAKEVVWMANDPTAPKRKSAMLLIKSGIGSMIASLLLAGVWWMIGSETGGIYALISLVTLGLGIVGIIVGGIMLIVANAQRDKLVRAALKAARK